MLSQNLQYGDKIWYKSKDFSCGNYRHGVFLRYTQDRAGCVVSEWCNERSTGHQMFKTFDEVSETVPEGYVVHKGWGDGYAFAIDK